MKEKKIAAVDQCELPEMATGGEGGLQQMLCNRSGDKTGKLVLEELREI